MNKVWKFADNINTDVLAPGLYMKGPVEVLAQHCLESVAADFASQVETGDMIVAGKNFGSGSSREQAAQVLRILGVQAVVAKSFGGIFYRNAFNLGLLAVVCPDVGQIQHGDELQINAREGQIKHLNSGQLLRCEVIPDHLLNLIAAGGLVPYLKHQRTSTQS